MLAAAILPLLSSTAAADTTQLAGVQGHMLWGDVSVPEMEEQLNIVQRSGASVLRVDVGWSSLQQTSASAYESWYLTKLDKLVEGADARGIKLLLTFESTPCWASSAPESIKQGCRGEWWSRGVQDYPPANPESYANALAFLVKRYRGSVYAWEIWNEPNLPEFWDTSEPAAEYVKLVKAAYPAAKAADPETTIVAGALSQSDYEFAARLFQLGMKGYFDAFSIHPYSENASPDAARSNPRYSFVDGVPKIRETMLAYGDAAPLWITETGYSTSTTRNGPAWTDGVSEAEQAVYIAEQATMIKKWPFVAVAIWYELENESEESSNLNANYGLLEHDGAAKAGWGSFLAAVQLLQDTPTESGATSGEEEASSGPPGSTQPESSRDAGGPELEVGGIGLGVGGMTGEGGSSDSTSSGATSATSGSSSGTSSSPASRAGIGSTATGAGASESSADSPGSSRSGGDSTARRHSRSSHSALPRRVRRSTVRRTVEAGYDRATAKRQSGEPAPRLRGRERRRYASATR